MLPGRTYPSILRPKWWYAVGLACALLGLGLLYADHIVGALIGLGTVAVAVVDFTVRAPRLRAEAFARLEARASEMSAADVNQHLAFITRYYGGSGLPSVRRRVERIRGLPRG